MSNQISYGETFRINLEAMRRFGFCGRLWQRAAWHTPEPRALILWFAYLGEYRGEKGGPVWGKNTLTENGIGFTDCRLGNPPSGMSYADSQNIDKKRLLFLRDKQFVRNRDWIFRGVFEVDRANHNGSTSAWIRTAETCECDYPKT